MNQFPSINLFNFEILNSDAQKAIELIFDQPKEKTVAFLNAHCINTARKDPIYRWALGRADVLLPDGSGLQLAAKLKGQRFSENLNGTDLFPKIMAAAAERKMKVFMFGSREGVAENAAIKARSMIPDLKIVGTRNGFFDKSEEEVIIDQINASGTDVLLVALGIPMQDVWIARNRHRLNAKVVFGVGAQFDFWAGRVSRAPEFFRNAGMEWIWRLAIEPKRMFKRYVFGNPIFVFRAIKESFSTASARKPRVNGKRLLDIILSGGALLALSPLVAAIVLAIRMESKGSAFFTQMRVGENGKQFKIYKFRSMYPDAEERRKAILHLSNRAGICFKSRNDPRVTRVGRLLRRLSLDELPQIINVLKGDMAIVGPRPALLREVEAYPEKAYGRLGTKPGLTGLWQISGRAEVSFDKMINMDLATVKSRTIFTDLAIIALTFRAVISGRGAY